MFVHGVFYRAVNPVCRRLSLLTVTEQIDYLLDNGFFIQAYVAFYRAFYRGYYFVGIHFGYIPFYFAVRRSEGIDGLVHVEYFAVNRLFEIVEVCQKCGKGGRSSFCVSRNIVHIQQFVEQIMPFHRRFPVDNGADSFLDFFLVGDIQHEIRSLPCHGFIRIRLIGHAVFCNGIAYDFFAKHSLLRERGYIILYLGNFPARIVEIIHRPQLIYIPAELTQNFRLHAYAVLDSFEFYAVFAVRDDCENVFILVFGIHHGDVDFEIGNAHVIVAQNSPVFKFFSYKLADTRRSARDILTVESKHFLAAFGIFEERFKTLDALTCGTAEVYHIAGNRAVYDHFAARTRYGYVKTLVSAALVYGAEIERKSAVLIGAVSHAEQNNVSLVALNVFQVLYEKRLVDVVSRRVQTAFVYALGKLIFYVNLLSRVKGNYAYAVFFLRGVFKSRDDVGHQLVAFLFIVFGTAALVNAVDVFKGHFAVKLVRRRESMQPVVVEHGVRKSDKAFMKRAIVPGQVILRHAESKTVFEYAFEVLDFVMFVVFIVRAEKGSGRKLLRVAYNDNVFGAHDAAHRFTSGNLRRFVENHEVEFFKVYVQKLSYRSGTHKHTRTAGF